MLFAACTWVYNSSEWSDYFPLNLPNANWAIKVSSRNFVRDNSPNEAFLADTELGWQPTRQNVGEWLQFKTFTVRKEGRVSPYFFHFF